MRLELTSPVSLPKRVRLEKAEDKEAAQVALAMTPDEIPQDGAGEGGVGLDTGAGSHTGLG